MVFIFVCGGEYLPREFTLLVFSFIGRPFEDIKPCLEINEISSSFFFLLLEILFLEGPATLSVVRNHTHI